MSILYCISCQPIYHLIFILELWLNHQNVGNCFGNVREQQSTFCNVLLCHHRPTTVIIPKYWSWAYRSLTLWGLNISHNKYYKVGKVEFRTCTFCRGINITKVDKAHDNAWIILMVCSSFKRSAYVKLSKGESNKLSIPSNAPYLKPTKLSCIIFYIAKHMLLNSGCL